MADEQRSPARIGAASAGRFNQNDRNVRPLIAKCANELVDRDAIAVVTRREQCQRAAFTDQALGIGGPLATFQPRKPAHRLCDHVELGVAWEQRSGQRKRAG